MKAQRHKDCNGISGPRSAIAFILSPRPEGFGSKMDPVGREASVDTLIYV